MSFAKQVLPERESLWWIFSLALILIESNISILYFIFWVIYILPFSKKGLRYTPNLYTITPQQSSKTMNEGMRRNTGVGKVNKIKLGGECQHRSACPKSAVNTGRGTKTHGAYKARRTNFSTETRRKHLMGLLIERVCTMPGTYPPGK